MRVKWKTNFDHTRAKGKAAKALNGRSVEVGATGENAWLAAIHEYGCRIKVTAKMRAFLHHKGIHLKKETTQIIIPERAFMRNGFDEYHTEVVDGAQLLFGEMLDGALSADDVLNSAGELLASKIRLYARDLRSPANAAATVKLKGSNNPLVDTGDMINSIKHEVK